MIACGRVLASAPAISLVALVGDDAHTIPLRCGIQHIVNEDAISGGRIVHKNMGNGADQFSVLNDRTAGHADVK